MYLHIGQSVLVPFESVLGVFDLDNSSWSHRTRSFVLCREGERSTVFLSQLSTATLKGRLEGNGLE